MAWSRTRQALRPLEPPRSELWFTARSCLYRKKQRKETHIADIERIGAEDLREAPGTEAIQRKVALEGDGFWIGVVTAEPNMASGWHHHSDNDTLVYLLDGSIRVEARDGKGAVEAAAGEFLHVPPRTVHREVNPETKAAHALVIRVGSGDPVVNVS